MAIAHVLFDTLGNEVRDPQIDEKLASALGAFEREHGCMIEGRLWIGGTIVWFQRSPGVNTRDFGNYETGPSEAHAPFDTTEFDKE